MRYKATDLRPLGVEILTLSTPRARLIAWASATIIIFIVPYAWLSNLSLWQYLGFDWAPSVGLTRAYWLLIHGDIAAAWQRNALIFAVLAVGIPLLLIDIYKIVGRQRRP